MVLALGFIYKELGRETSLEWQEHFSHFQDTMDALPCHIYLPACLWIMDPHSRAAKKNTSHGKVCLLVFWAQPTARGYIRGDPRKEVLPQDTMHLIQRPCYNEEVHTEIQHAIGSHENIQTIVKWCKLKWYGHVSPSSGLANTILQGTVKGGRRQCRQKKRWEDIREWTGLEFTKSQWAVK